MSPKKPVTAAAVPEDVLTREHCGKVEVRVEDEDAFFKRVREKIAARSSGARTAPAAPTLAFSSLSDFIQVVTPQRARLVETLRAQGGFASVTALAEALHRDRGTVSKDVRALAAAGLLRVQEKEFPGHGKSLSIEPLAEKLHMMF